ncbi:hypothetical protein BV22DRAFT_1193167 [Leucogyrophana mollusca]|uniref:Uncharacterized protein n=1 Tax=Leucogyrophana mollusca TaxID=85980 RepID=A0ACB8BT36_9AGAM|nr:hypothetical protein BV22DRAFT_1193167 [Leucogyrophana mollusca]
MPRLTSQYFAPFFTLIRRYLSSCTSYRPVARLLLLLPLLRRGLFRRKPEELRDTVSSAEDLRSAHEVDSVHLDVACALGSAPICPSLLPPDRNLDIESSSDVPYDGSSNHLTVHAPQPLRRPTHVVLASTESQSSANSSHTDVEHVAPPLRPSSAASNGGHSEIKTLEVDSALGPSYRRHSQSPVAQNPSSCGAAEEYRTPGTPSTHSNPILSSLPLEIPDSLSRSLSPASLRSRASHLSTYRPHDELFSQRSSNAASPTHMLVTTDPDQSGELVTVTQSIRVTPMSTKGLNKGSHLYGRPMIDPEVSDHIIGATTIEYPAHEEHVPNGWTKHIHPEGARYFLHAQTRTYTEVDICHPDILEDVDKFSNFLWAALRERNLCLVYDEVELVLEPMCDGDEILCGYYFINPTGRCLFWLEDFDARHIFETCKGVTALSHKRFAVQAEYWKHWEYFPNLCRLNEGILDELRDLILHASCGQLLSDRNDLTSTNDFADQLTSNQSSAPFSANELQNHLIIVDRIKAGSAGENGHSACIIGKMMYAFARNKYVNFHGQQGARLSPDQRVYHWRYKRSKTMNIVAPLLFNAPDTYIRSLHSTFVDEITRIVTWKGFTAKLNNELREFNLLATVLLNANVGFLAIQSVDNGGGRAATQIASYISLVASIGSIVLGLTFVRHTPTSGRDPAAEVIADFLARINDRDHGLETLAIIYSLPFALLMWGMVFFLIAFSIEWCKPGDVPSLVPVGVVLFVVCSLVIWCAYIAGNEQGGVDNNPQEYRHSTSDLVSSREHLPSRFLNALNNRLFRNSAIELQHIDGSPETQIGGVTGDTNEVVERGDTGSAV